MQFLRNANQATDSGFSPLYKACREGHLECVPAELLQRAAGGEGEAAALIRRAAPPWSPASHSLFPAAARARAALLVLSLYEIHERHHLDSAGNTNGIAARDFVACVLRFAVTRESE